MPDSFLPLRPDENSTNGKSERKRGGVLCVYASIAAAGALLIFCFSLFHGIYSIIGLSLPWLDLGVPEALLRQLIHASIALPIAVGVLIFHFKLLKQQSA